MVGHPIEEQDIVSSSPSLAEVLVYFSARFSFVFTINQWRIQGGCFGCCSTPGYFKNNNNNKKKRKEKKRRREEREKRKEEVEGKLGIPIIGREQDILETFQHNDIVKKKKESKIKSKKDTKDLCFRAPKSWSSKRI